MAEPAARALHRGVEAGPAAAEPEAASSASGVSVEFVSRGDDSGTHRKERSLWSRAGVDPSGSWYMEVGQGMAETLRLAAEKRADVPHGQAVAGVDGEAE